MGGTEAPYVVPGLVPRLPERGWATIGNKSVMKVMLYI